MVTSTSLRNGVYFMRYAQFCRFQIPNHLPQASERPNPAGCSINRHIMYLIPAKVNTQFRAK